MLAILAAEGVSQSCFIGLYVEDFTTVKLENCG